MHARRLIVGCVTLALVAIVAAWWFATAGRPADGTTVEAPTATAVPSIATADESPAPRLAPLREDAAAAHDGTADTIAGVVVDEVGEPIEGAEIVTTATVGVRTDAAGRFRVRRGQYDCEREAIRIVASPADSACASLLVERWVPWGTNDLRFVLAHRVPLHVELVDAMGRPVLAEVHLGEASPHEWNRRDVTLRGDGAVEFPLAAPGDCTLHVVRHPESFARPRPVRVEVRGPTRARIVFGALAECRVRVERADGSVARGSEVLLVDVGEQSAAAAFARDHDSPFRRAYESPDGLVDRARVDDGGSVVLHGDAQVAYVVRVIGDHMPVLVEGVRCGPAEPLRVRLAAGAEVRVRLGPPAERVRLLALQSSLGLARASDGCVRYLRATSVDGTLAAADLGPGDWSLCFVWGPLAHTFARVTLSGTQVVELEAAMPWLQVATIRVRMRRESGASNDTVCLQRERPGEGPPAAGQWLSVPTTSSESGVIVQAGRYRARRLGLPQGLSTAVIDAPPDATVDVEVAIPVSSVEITLRDRRGEPVPDVRLGLVREGVMTREDELPDSDGNGVVESGCGVGTFEVVALPKLVWQATTGSLPQSVPLVAHTERRTLLGTITVCEGQRTVAAFVLP